jgi:hypothetical protein
MYEDIGNMVLLKSSLSEIQVQPLRDTYTLRLCEITFTAFKYTYSDFQVNYVCGTQTHHFLEWREVHRYST